MYKILLLLISFNAIASPSYWQLNQQRSNVSLSEMSDFDIQAKKFQLVEFDENSLLQEFARDQNSEKTISLPLPNGEFEDFIIYKVNIMSEKLSIKYPNFHTYRGRSVETNKSLVLDITHMGLHAVIQTVKGPVWIDPINRETNKMHMSYFKSDLYLSERSWKCDVEEHNHEYNSDDENRGGTIPTNELSLKTYRLAVAATAEYTAFHSNGAANVQDGMAAIVTAMNRVNGIYEIEVGIRMTLIDNNDLLVFTDSATDGYSNNNGFAMLSQNRTKINSVIGSANYDIGHVFSTGGGGIAGLGVPCGTRKAEGVTGLPSPVNDAFYVDYVAHEMGHQWGANHIFNSSSGGCGGGNRSSTAAYEPGSGSTIMGYAALCGSHNLQNFSDAYFNNHSLKEIINYSTNSTGSNCSVIVDTMNEAPVVDAGSNYTIPNSTPFKLCAEATDDDESNMTFNWEQNDLGPTGHPNTPTGNAPAFRSFEAVTDNCRTFPMLSSILNNSFTKGERLPTYARNMNFRATVRDNELSGGAIGTGSMRITVTADGPFQLTSHNTSDTIVTGVENSFSWDIANTDQSPVNCSTVDIDFSQDGGLTFADAVTGIPNTGTGTAMVPSSMSSNIRVRIKCSDNIFFDINDTDLSHIDDLIFDNGFESL